MRILYQQTQRRIESCITYRLEFCKHIHDDIEIVVVQSGHVKAAVDANEYDLYPGDIFVAFPNKIHSYTSLYDNERSALIFLSSYLFSEYASILNDCEPVVPVIRKENIPDGAMAILNQAMLDQNQGFSYKNEILKGYYLIFLGKILPLFQYKTRKKGENELLSTLLEYCNSNYADDISLENLSEALHVSKYYVSHLFSDKIHVKFNEYIHSLRINDACIKLISTDLPISEIAHSVGYNTIRSFNRSFVKQMNVTPTEYRMRHPD